MKVLIEQHGAPGPGGRAPVLRRTVQAEWIRVGRHASSELHLPDPRVPLAKGMIVDRDGPVYIEGEAGSHDITRKTVHAVRLKPGVPLEIGPYRIEAKPPPEGYDAALEVRLVHPLPAAGGLASHASRLTLAAHRLPKRGAAWALAIAILLLGFAVPAGRVLHAPWHAAADSAVGDRLWDPGPLILAHQPLATKCGACHQVAFRHVKDAACLECHRTVGAHVPARLEQAALFGESRCASCHRDHKGAHATFRDDDRFCIACHRDLHREKRDTALEDVSDFAHAHPAFSIALPQGAGVRLVRQGEGATLAYASNLHFPHAKHLDPQGVKSPDKGRVKLDCASCHHPDASKRGFEPISMARDCQSCHRLRFEPAVSEREAPHGNPGEAVAMIEDFYANLALRGTPDSFQKAFGVRGEGLLRRVGEPEEAQRTGALRMAQAKAQKVAHDLFEVRVCKTCHRLTREAGSALAWKVAPVRTSRHWMPAARFDHRAHASTPCADCHDVARSRDAGEVAMPTIDTCRKCHGGARAAAGKVPSNCMLCHAFHDARHPWTPNDVERTALAH
jgi:hypothetical protein